MVACVFVAHGISSSRRIAVGFPERLEYTDLVVRNNPSRRLAYLSWYLQMFKLTGIIATPERTTALVTL